MTRPHRPPPTSDHQPHHHHALPGVRVCVRDDGRTGTLACLPVVPHAHSLSALWQGGEDGGDLCHPSLAISLLHALLPTRPPFCMPPTLSPSAHLPCLANPFVRMTATHVTTTRVASIPVVHVTATHVTICVASLSS